MRLCYWTALLFAAGAGAAEKPDPSAEFFKMTGKVPVFQITVDKAEADSLRREPRKYVKCTLKVGDQTLKDVAIHLKGAAGSFRGFDDKPALTLNTDHFKKGQRFQGMDKFHLNNSVQDPTYLDEWICGGMALEAGVPTARAAHALVELNGRKLGFYVFKEGYNKTFLHRFFEDVSGNMYDGGFLTDIDSPLKLDTGSDNGRKDLQALAKACREPNGDKRFAALEKVLDVDKMISNACMQIICTDWDGYCRNRNNYRIYFDPKSGKATFIPHGMDQMFQNPGDALWPGWGGMAARALIETPEGKKRFIARLKEMTAKNFKLEDIYKKIDAVVPRAKEAMESVQKGAGKNYENEVKAFKDRLKQRSDFLARELPKLK
jgi:spore coat protein CotH